MEIVSVPDSRVTFGQNQVKFVEDSLSKIWRDMEAI